MNTKQTTLVTGAYGAIGKAIARQIAEKGYRTVLLGRDELKLKKATDEIISVTGNRDVFFKPVDLSRKSSIIELSEKWKWPLNILINNAASAPQKRIETQEGIEVQFATNVLGYFWMIEYLSGLMKNAEGAKIVNVASYWAGGLDINDLGFGGHETPAEGADTPVWVAPDPSLKNISGRYFENRKEVSCPFSKDRNAIEQLFSICEKY